MQESTLEHTTSAPKAVMTALVTGGARRIGAEIVCDLHARGMNIALHYRESRAEAETLAERLNHRRPGSVLPVQADLTRAESLQGLVDATTDRFGRLDILVNNASTFYPTPVGRITESAWDDLMGTNLKAPLFLSQAATPALEASGGCIINIVDIHADKPMKGHPVYCAAKAGLSMLTKSLARELGPDIRVNGIAPGAILWPENAISGDHKSMIVERTALKRAGSPEDIAQAVAFLVLDAPYITGHILPVDGGRSLSM